MATKDVVGLEHLFAWSDDLSGNYWILVDFMYTLYILIYIYMRRDLDVGCQWM